MGDPPAWSWELAPAQPDAAGCGYLLFLMATKISSSRQGARRDSNRAPLPRQHRRGPQNPPDGGSWGGSPLLSRGCKHDRGDIRAERCWDRETSGDVGEREEPPRAGWQPAAPDSKGWTGRRTASPGPQDSQSLSECHCAHVSVQGGMTSDTRATSLGCASSLLSPQAALGEARDRGNGPKIALQQHSRGRATAGGTEVTSGRARPALWWLWLGHGMGTRRA